MKKQESSEKKQLSIQEGDYVKNMKSDNNDQKTSDKKQSLTTRTPKLDSNTFTKFKQNFDSQPSTTVNKTASLANSTSIDIPRGSMNHNFNINSPPNTMVNKTKKYEHLSDPLKNLNK